METVKLLSPEERGVITKWTVASTITIIEEVLGWENIVNVKEDGFFQIFPKIPYDDIASLIPEIIETYERMGWKKMKIEPCSDLGIDKISIHLWWK